MNHQQQNQPDTQQEAQSAAQIVLSAMRFLRVLYRRRSIVIAALVVAGLLGAIYYLTATRIYKATASLLVLQTGNDVWSTKMSAEGNHQGLIPTYERLFSSAVVLKGALQKLQEMPPAARIDFAEAPPEKWVAVLRDNLSARAIKNTNLIEIEYRSKDPEAAEAVVAAVVQSYLEFMEENHKNVAAEIVTILKTEQADVEQRLKQKRGELLELQRRARVLGIEEGTAFVHPAVARVARLNETLVEVQKERVRLQAGLGAIEKALQDGGDIKQYLVALEPAIGKELTLSALGLSPHDAETFGNLERALIRDRAQLESLDKHYGPAHPKIVEIQRRIHNTQQYLANYQQQVNNRMAGMQSNRLAGMLQAMVREKLAGTLAHERELERQYRLEEGEAVRLNGQLAELTLAKRDMERLHSLHETLEDRIANLGLNQENSSIRVAVTSEPNALPQPVSPRLSIVVMMCLLAGTSCGAALVYVLDVMDDRFRSPDELKEQLQTPVLALIRQLEESDAYGVEALQVHTAPEAVESEAFRTLRTTLAFSTQGASRLVISSSEPGDGKTTVLANLGAAYAQAGSKTLLIDADLRRPGLSRLFNMRGLKGLSEVLRSDADLDTCCAENIQATGNERLDVLPCGPKPADPTEVLSSARMEDLLAWAETVYDQILIDSPPVLAASDSAIVGRLAEGVVLVVQPEKNHRRRVLRAAEELTSLGVGLLGVVVNRVGSEKDRGYYGYDSDYGFGYGYSYDSGYHEDEDEQAYDEAATEVATQGDRASTNPPRITPRRAA